MYSLAIDGGLSLACVSFSTTLYSRGWLLNYNDNVSLQGKIYRSLIRKKPLYQRNRNRKYKGSSGRYFYAQQKQLEKEEKAFKLTREASTNNPKMTML